MSVQVTVQGINVPWKGVYNFERLCSVSFGNLKRVVQAGNPILEKQKQIFVYMGCVATSDEILLYDPRVDVEIQNIELGLYVANFNVRLPRNTDWKIDEASIIAAKKYFSAHERKRSSILEDLTTLMDSLSGK